MSQFNTSKETSPLYTRGDMLTNIMPVLEAILAATGGGGGGPQLALEATQQTVLARATVIASKTGITVDKLTDVITLLNTYLYDSVNHETAADLLSLIRAYLYHYPSNTTASQILYAISQSVGAGATEATLNAVNGSLTYDAHSLTYWFVQFAQSGGKGVSQWCQESRDVLSTQNPADESFNATLGASEELVKTMSYRACSLVQVNSFTGNVSFLGSIDNATYFPVLLEKLDTGGMVSVVDTIGIYRLSQSIPYFKIITDVASSVTFKGVLTSKNS